MKDRSSDYGWLRPNFEDRTGGVAPDTNTSMMCCSCFAVAAQSAGQLLCGNLPDKALNLGCEIAMGNVELFDVINIFATDAQNAMLD